MVRSGLGAGDIDSMYIEITLILSERFLSEEPGDKSLDVVFVLLQFSRSVTIAQNGNVDAILRTPVIYDSLKW